MLLSEDALANHPYLLLHQDDNNAMHNDRDTPKNIR